MGKSRADSRNEERKRRKSERKAKTVSRSGKDRKSGAVKKGKIREWLDAMIFAVVVMVILRTLFFDLFRIPTPSMEKNLMVGDYLFVSKLHYGTRTPMTLGIPFTSIYIPGLSFPYTRLPGFSEVKRGDAIVFNWPADNVAEIERKQHYIKRLVGLPGETIRVDNKTVIIDDVPQALGPGMQQHWLVHKTDPRVQLNRSALEELGIFDVIPASDRSIEQLVATEAAIDIVATWPWVERVEPAVAPSNSIYDMAMYPPGRGWTPDNYGPVTIPAEGATVELTPETWQIYQTVISKYEGHTASLEGDGSFVIDGHAVTHYTFEQDYFFVMGDNRDNSEDSRFWGFVPMDHVVGKALMVYFSWDANSFLPRFGRIFSKIN